MPYYHSGINPLIRDHRSPMGAYWVTHMDAGQLVYIMDDFGNAVPLSLLRTHAVNLFMSTR